MNRQPTRISALYFAAKANGLRLQRFLKNTAQPLITRSGPSPQRFPHEVARNITPLRSGLVDGLLPTEQWYETGKIQNLQTAANSLDGCLLRAGATFSFWKHIGRPSTKRGFATGRMLQEGCLIPSIGGGLCQLSNALYQVAFDTGCEIIERHAHSRAVPGSAAAAGRDATVAWNYIDLRFRPPVDMQLHVDLTTTDLVVKLFAATLVASTHTSQLHITPASIGEDHACDTCGAHDCFRKHSGPLPPETKPNNVPPCITRYTEHPWHLKN